MKMILKTQHLKKKLWKGERPTYCSVNQKRTALKVSLPDANPVSVTTSHPDHASYKLFVISHADSFFLLLI